MELLLLQFHWTLVHLRVFGLRTEGLPSMQPEVALIEGMGLGASEVCTVHQMTLSSYMLIVSLRV